MSGIQIVILMIILLLVPTAVGSIFAGVYKGEKSPVFAWISGQMVLWAGFLLITVPLILLEKTFSQVRMLYGFYVGGLLAVAVLAWICRRLGKKQTPGEKTTGSMSVPESGTPAEAQAMWGAASARLPRGQILLWTVFGALLLLQLVLSVCLAYEEGDDAFYVAISTATASSERMYQTLPYTGLTTQLDARHGLAPFPVWIAYLSKMSSAVTVTVAQMVVPIFVILMAYGIYYLLAGHLFRERKQKIPFFLILVELMILFGGYSVYSAENFLLVRATQGKAVVANLILPFLIYLLFVLLDKLKRQEGFGWQNWILLASTMTAGCLCSTLGSLLTCIMLGIVGVCAAVCYRKLSLLVPLALCCVIPGAMALMYFMLR